MFPGDCDPGLYKSFIGVQFSELSIEKKIIYKF